MYFSNTSVALYNIVQSVRTWVILEVCVGGGGGQWWVAIRTLEEVLRHFTCFLFHHS